MINVKKQVYYKIWDQIYYQFSKHVEDQGWEPVWEEVFDYVQEQVRNKIYIKMDMKNG